MIQESPLSPPPVSVLEDDRAQMMRLIADRMVDGAGLMDAIYGEMLRLRAWLRWIAPRDPDARRALEGDPAPAVQQGHPTCRAL